MILKKINYMVLEMKINLSSLSDNYLTRYLNEEKRFRMTIL